MPANVIPLIESQAPLLRSQRRKYTPRFPRDELLDLLGPGQSREATMSHLKDYQQLFAYRYTGAIVTKTGYGPGGWTAYKRPLGLYQIALHLLANRVPGRQPIWYGSRSLPRSRYLCLDVDADRTPEQILAKKYPWHEEIPEHVKAAVLREIADDLASRPAKARQAERIALVKRALRRMGINSDNPRSVLNLASPSGGRHIYVFFDALYSLDQYYDLLHAAGLRHVPGEIEFYPATSHAFRLPFGYLPGQLPNLYAWMQFIDDFRNRRIIGHSLADLQNTLAEHWSTQSRRIESRKAAVAQGPEIQKTLRMGLPKHARKQKCVRAPQTRPNPEQRFLELLDGIHFIAEAEELLNLGILVDGKRTKVLNHLAIHLIWFKNLSADDAATFLTEWAINPRHVSKDIAADLANGTTIVARHIITMCRWYGAHKQTSGVAPTDDTREFSPRELNALRPSLVNLTGEDRHNQAGFLLHLLRFAKLHPIAVDDATGWEAAPAVRPVIRRWPGCSHMNYKTRIAHATAAGILTKIKRAWHRVNGPGRATTYRLSVPVVPRNEWVLSYEVALETLTKITPAIDSQAEVSQNTVSKEEGTNASNSSRSCSGSPTHHHGGVLPSPLPPPCSRAHLDLGPRQCDPQPPPAAGLSSQNPGTGSAATACQ